MLNRYLENEKGSTISQCKNLSDIIAYVKRYITDVAKPSRKLRAVNSEYFSKDSSVEPTRSDSLSTTGPLFSNKNAKSDKPVIQSTLSIGKGNKVSNAVDDMVLQQVLSKLNTLQSDMKTNKKNFSNFQRDYQKSRDSKLTEALVSTHVLVSCLN